MAIFPFGNYSYESDDNAHFPARSHSADAPGGSAVAVLELSGSSFRRNPLFPTSGPATGSFNGHPPKSKFLAVIQMDASTTILILSITLLLDSPMLNAASLIGNSDSDWKPVPGNSGNSGGSFSLETAPGNIASGVNGGEVIAFTPTAFGAPTVGSTYTFSGSLLFPTADTTFVFGFANDTNLPWAAEFMEIVVNVENDRSAGIMWIGGTSTVDLMNPDIKLLESVYSGTGISATGQTLFDLTWTFDSSKNWTLSGSIESNGVTLWDTPITTTAAEPLLENSGSSFLIGAPFGEVTNIASGSFTGPVPEPSAAALLAVGGAMVALRRRRRATHNV